MISYRIQKIVDMVPSDISFLGDIGSDHGYFIKEVHKRYPKLKLFACDNKKGPFERLKTNLQNIDNVIVSLSDGFDALDNEVDIVSMTGLGGGLIVSIIEKGKQHLDHLEYLLLSPHCDAYKVRDYLYKKNYQIISEDFIFDSNIFYPIILFKKGKSYISEKEKKYGPFILKKRNKAFLAFINKEIIRCNSLLENDKLSSKRKNELLLYLKELKTL